MKSKIDLNLLDRAIMAVDPIRGARRLRARAVLALAGAYTGARKDRRQTSQWTTTGGSADDETLWDLPTLRERSADLCRNAPLALGAINTKVTCVVGTGLKLQSRVDYLTLGISQEDAEAFQIQAEREFDLWADSVECDATRTQDFYGQQELAFRSTLERGDVFCLLPYIERPGSPYGLKLNLIEADQVTNKDNARDTEALAGGVQLDEHGAPVAYHFLKSHPGGLTRKAKEWTVVQAFGERTGRRNVIHLFSRRRPGQHRGVPDLAPVIETLKQLDRYTEAEIMAAVMSGMFTVFVKTEGGQGLSPMSPTSETGGSTSDTDFKMASGAILGLAPTESVEFANPSRPNTAFDPFVMSVLRQVGVALELPFEVLIKHFTASYSASRAALLEAWRFFKGRRAWLARNFCQPIYEAVIDEAVARGRLIAPGYFEDELIRKAWLGSVWAGDAPGHIQPLQEANAMQVRIQAGVTTLSHESMEYNGGDFDVNYPQIVKERKMMAEVAKLSAPTDPTQPEPIDPADQ